MKGRFFKKSRQQQIPHSASFDSQLSQQQPQQQELPLNCSIDKPGLRPIGECPSPMPPSVSSGDVRHLQQLLAPPPVLHSSLCQLSPLSSHDCSSSSQGMTGCANHLFESTGRWELPAEMRLLADSNNSRRRQLQRRHFVEETEANLGHSSALVKCPEAAPIVSKMPTSMASRAHGNQVADLVFTLAQQLSSKDDEISRLRSQLRKSEGRWERQWQEMERELERKAQELDGAREQLSRMRRRLRGCEAELEMASRQQPRGMVREEGQQLLELERRQLEAENQQLKDKLTREAKLQADRELQWERERVELKQSVQSLNGALEELESELRQREVREREMQLTLERRLVEREIGRMGVGGREDRETANSSMVDLPSPKTDSSLSDGLCCPSASASNTSGLGSLLAKELPDQKQLDKLLAKARWRLAECRVKIAQLIQTAEKTQRGERLSRQDLFGTSLSTGELQQREDHQLQHPSCWSASASVDEHLKQIAAIQRDLELLHDKFTILYAKGIFGR